MAETVTAPAVVATTAAPTITTTAPATTVASPVSTTAPAETLLDTAGKTDATTTSTESLLDGAKAGEEKVKEGETLKEEVKAPVVPEKYDLKVPEGMVIDEAKLTAFSAVAKDLGLSNEQAQKLVDFQANIVKEQESAGQSAFEKLKNDFYQETVKEYGPKLKEELVYVAKGRDMIADKEAVELLNQAGLSNNKAIIRMFGKVGKFLSEGKLVDGQTAVTTPKSDGEVLYPNLPKRK